MDVGGTRLLLRSIRIDNYRSCKSAVFTLNDKVSALIGINGAGKTNILSALRLLSTHSARRARIVSDAPGAQTAEIAPKSPTKITAWFSLGAQKIGLRLRLRLSNASGAQDDIVVIKEEWNLSKLGDLALSKTTWVVLHPIVWDLVDYGRLKELGHRYTNLSTRREIRFAGWRTHAHELPNAEIIKAVVDSDIAVPAIVQVNTYRAGITYYSASQFTDPTRCPTNFELDSSKELELGYRGPQPHLRFLYDLYSLKRNQSDQYDEYVQFVGPHHLGLISRLSWKEVKLSSHTVDVKSGGKFKKQKRFKTLLIPTIKVGHSLVSFNQMSEGTFRTLAMIFYVMTNTSDCLLIEEPEVCVHHGLLTKIVDTIKTYSIAKQIVLSSHSDVVIDRLEPTNVFVVENGPAGTRVSNLLSWAGKEGRSALRNYLREAGSLGEYWKTGGLSV